MWEIHQRPATTGRERRILAYKIRQEEQRGLCPVRVAGTVIGHIGVLHAMGFIDGKRAEITLATFNSLTHRTNGTRISLDEVHRGATKYGELL